MFEQLAQCRGIATVDPFDQIRTLVDPRFDLVSVAIDLIHASQGTRNALRR